MRCDPGAAAALHDGRRGVGADHRDSLQRAGVERQDALAGDVGVAEEDHGCGRGLPRQPPSVGIVDGGLRGLDEVGAHPVEEPQQPTSLLDNHVARDLSGFDRGGQRGPEVLCGSRHLEVEPGEGGLHRGVGGEPVRHHEPVEAPLLLEDGRQQPGVLAAEGAVDAVVRGHHRPDLAIAHGGLERAEVDLAQRPLVHVAADRVPLDLGVVGHEVLDAGGDPPALHAAHEGDREPSGERRILAVGLEVPASERVADQVDRRPEQHVGGLGAGLVGDGRAHPLDQVRIEGGAERRAAREQGRCGRRVALAPCPDRTVGHLQARHAALRQALGVPVVLARRESGQLLEGEVVREVLVAIGHRPRPASRCGAHPTPGRRPGGPGDQDRTTRRDARGAGWCPRPGRRARRPACAGGRRRCRPG